MPGKRYPARADVPNGTIANLKRPVATMKKEEQGGQGPSSAHDYNRPVCAIDSTLAPATMK